MRERGAGHGSAAVLLLVCWLGSACAATVDGAATTGAAADRSLGSSGSASPSSYLQERRLLSYDVTIGHPPDTSGADGASGPRLADALRSLAESRGVHDVNIVATDRGTVEVRTTTSPDVVNAALVGDRTLTWLPVDEQSVVPDGGCDVTPSATRQCSIDGQFVYTLAQAPFDLTVIGVQAVQDPQPGAILRFDDATGKHIARYTAAHVGKAVALSDGSVVISAPVIRAPIVRDSLQLSGSLTADRQQETIALLTLAAWQVDVRPS